MAHTSPSHVKVCAATILSVILFTHQASAWLWTLEDNADFSQCFAKLKNISDADAYNRLHPGTFYDAAHRILSTTGCQQLCGKGYEIYFMKDIIDRFSLWLLPALILITHFSFAPLGVLNYVKVTIHAVADPIDSIWSLLTRFENNRQLLRLAEEYIPGAQESNGGDLDRSSIAEHVAAIWAAYEEISWQDASTHFTEVINSRILKGHQQITAAERQHIREASHTLSSMRQTSLLFTFIPVLTLAIGMITAIFKLIFQIGEINSATDGEIPPTLSVVSLLFTFIPLVVFSGNLGSFLTVNGAAETIHKMRDDIGIESGGHQNSLFPSMDINLDATSRTCTCMRAKAYGPVNPEEEKPRAAHESYLGMPLNSTWRPCKHILPYRPLDGKKSPVRSRSRGLLFIYSLFFVLLGSCVPAVFLSATNIEDKKVAIGCRTVSWLIVMMLWLCGVTVDLLLVYPLCKDSSRSMPAKLRLVWNLTILKDSLIASVIIVLVTFQQVGVYNNCWCTANISGYVVLGRGRDVSRRRKLLLGTIGPCFFLLNLVLIGWILLVGGAKTGVLCKSQTTLKRDGEILFEREEMLSETEVVGKDGGMKDKIAVAVTRRRTD